MSDEEQKAFEKKWNALEDDAMRQLSMAAEAERFPLIVKMGSEYRRLRSLATRYYLADGTFETLPEGEVIRRRKEAAKALASVKILEKKCGDVENFIRKEMLYDHPSDASIIGQKIRDYLLGKV